MVNALRVYSVASNNTGVAVNGSSRPTTDGDNDAGNVAVNAPQGASTIIVIGGDNKGSIRVGGEGPRIGGDPNDCPGADDKAGPPQDGSQQPGRKSITDREIIKVLLALLMQLAQKSKAGEKPGCCGQQDDPYRLAINGASKQPSLTQTSASGFEQPALNTVM